MTQRSAEPAVEGWFIAQAAREATDSIDPEQEHWFGLTEDGRLRSLATAAAKGAVLHWVPDAGWHALLPEDDPRRELLDLYLPVSSATPGRPIIVGHLGQSLDGFIATHTGDACFVTGPQNILHLHRLRALCDAVIVGARTVENDNPRLTTRLVSGTNPVRVVLDPHNRLAGSHHVFRDGDARLSASLLPVRSRSLAVTCWRWSMPATSTCTSWCASYGRGACTGFSWKAAA